MAYKGSLFTIGGQEFPHKWIYRDSYSVTPHIQDLDSERNTNGRLIRNVLDHKSVTITFQTVPMSLDDYEEMWAFIRENYTIAREHKLHCTYYSFEDGEMLPMDCYIPDTTHNPYYLKRKEGIINSTTLEFIGY